jgi:hypothetical protein
MHNIREIQIKTRMRYHFTPGKMTLIRNVTSVDEDMEKSDHHILLAGM